MNTSAHQGIAMSGVIQDKQSLNFEAAAKGPADNVDTGKHSAMDSTQRGPVASIFRPLPKISKANTFKPPTRALWTPRPYRMVREETPLVVIPAPRLSKAYVTSETLKFSRPESTGNLSASYYSSESWKEELVKAVNKQ